MNDNDIIKALECCSVHPMKCRKCPYQGIECCTNAHRKDALDLIERQKAEIERYKTAFPHFEHKNMDFCGVLCDFAEELINKAKADAIKEFAEIIKMENGNAYLNEYCESGDLFVVFNQDKFENFIDSLVKEMTEKANDTIL